MPEYRIIKVNSREQKEFPFVGQAPAKDGFIKMHHAHQGSKNDSDNPSYKNEVDKSTVMSAQWQPFD